MLRLTKGVVLPLKEPLFGIGEWGTKGMNVFQEGRFPTSPHCIDGFIGGGGGLN